MHRLSWLASSIWFFRFIETPILHSSILPGFFPGANFASITWRIRRWSNCLTGESGIDISPPGQFSLGRKPGKVLPAGIRSRLRWLHTLFDQLQVPSKILMIASTVCKFNKSVDDSCNELRPEPSNHQQYLITEWFSALCAEYFAK